MTIFGELLFMSNSNLVKVQIMDLKNRIHNFPFKSGLSNIIPPSQQVIAGSIVGQGNVKTATVNSSINVSNAHKNTPQLLVKSGIHVKGTNNLYRIIASLLLQRNLVKVAYRYSISGNQLLQSAFIESYVVTSILLLLRIGEITVKGGRED